VRPKVAWAIASELTDGMIKGKDKIAIGKAWIKGLSDRGFHIM
jgi:hypothetical protein